MLSWRRIATISVAFCIHALATDTAFWKPYVADDQAVLLLQGDPASPLPGRFGKGYVFTGGDGLTVPLEELYQSGQLSIEAWVKLTAYSPREGIILQRQPLELQSRGFSLSITPDGALRLTVTSMLGDTSVIESEAGRVPLGQWVHLAGVSVTSHYSVLYVNGLEIARESLATNRGLRGARRDELVPAPLLIGKGLRGLLDDVRVHRNVSKLWPLPERGWLERIEREGLAPLASVLPPPNHPRLYFSFNGPDGAVDSAEAPDDVKVQVTGKRVSGVEGQALRGTLSLSFTESISLDSGGSLTFWFRPVAINNYSDRNVNLLTSPAFSAYIFNGGGPPRPLSMYWYDEERNVHMYSDQLHTELHPGAWVHATFTWDVHGVTMYLDGREAAATGESLSRPENGGLLPGLAFNSREFFGDLDEVMLFDRRLTSAEAANLYQRYADPDAVRTDLKPVALKLDGWYMQSENRLRVRVHGPANARGTLTLTLLNDQDQLVLQNQQPYSSDLQPLQIPNLPDGSYALTASLQTDDRSMSSDTFRFERRHFPWEGNTLGMSRRVYPPFTPIRVDGREVSVVQRTCTINGFGLWDSVISDGEELLASPMRLVCRTSDGRQDDWVFGDGRLIAAAEDVVAWSMSAEHPAVRVESLSEVEMDGMMRVTMTLRPGQQVQEIESMWLEIPLRESMVTLMHEDTASHRGNYSGLLPTGEGIVWASANSHRPSSWLNAFTGYVWLGREQRGLAWFAENDRGWITHKDGGERSLQTISREDGKVILRIHLVNRPAIIDEPRELVFGLQASPTKPMPENWRMKAHELPDCGISVHPWGGLSCAYKFPHEDRWEVVDKVIENQKSGTVDGEWFRQYQEAHDIPPVHGIRSWVTDVARFATQRQRPVLVYFEEMKALTTRPEWRVFQDEWSLVRLSNRTWPDDSIFRLGTEVNPGIMVNFIDSYRDYGAWYGNEWLKRGISPYWDNTYLKLSVNPWTSSAYETADGRIQPATTLWNQRAYMKRFWNLMHEWRLKQPDPLEFVAHMTNTNLLPLFSWCTVSYNLEMSKSQYAKRFAHLYDPAAPYDPGFIRAELLGQKVGNHPYLVFGLFQYQLPDGIVRGLPEEIFNGEREWAMRMVHEINRGGPASHRVVTSMLEKAVFGFGYGSDEVDVHTYWQEPAALTASHPDLKWILLTRPKEKEALLVLQSWSTDNIDTTLSFDPAVIGFLPGPNVIDERSGTQRPTGPQLALRVDGPYAMQVLRLSPRAMYTGNVVLTDDFTHGPSRAWDYVSVPAVAPEGALRFTRNTTSWMGAQRLARWSGVEHWQDVELSLRFRLAAMPAATLQPFSLCLRGEIPPWSRHGLSHTIIRDGWWLNLSVDGETSSWRFNSAIRDDKEWRQRQSSAAAPADTQWHHLRLRLQGDAATVWLDDKQILEGTELPLSGRALALHAADNLDAIEFLEIDDIVMRQLNPTPPSVPAVKTAASAPAVRAASTESPALRELKAAGLFDADKYRNIETLGYFSRPDHNARSLIAMHAAEKHPLWKRLIRETLYDLPRQREAYQREMSDIGQNPERLLLYDQAARLIEEWIQANPAP